MMRIFILIFLTLILSACGKNGRRRTLDTPCSVPTYQPVVAAAPVVCSEPHYDPQPKKFCKKKVKRRCCPCPKKKIKKRKPRCDA